MNSFGARTTARPGKVSIPSWNSKAVFLWGYSERGLTLSELKGATLWARQTIESDIFFYKPDKWFKIWFFIVNKVNYSDSKLFRRGSNLMTYSEISEFTKATKNQIDMFMRWAKKEQMLTTQKTTRGMIVTILNYSKYQEIQNYKNDTQNELQTKCKRNGNDTINKKNNNIKNEKNTLCPHKDIVDLWSSILPELTQPQSWDEGDQKLLKARWMTSGKTQTLEWWESFFKYIRDSPFLMGDIDPSPGHKRFRLRLQWVLKNENFKKIIDGFYHN